VVTIQYSSSHLSHRTHRYPHICTHISHLTSPFVSFSLSSFFHPIPTPTPIPTHRTHKCKRARAPLTTESPQRSSLAPWWQSWTSWLPTRKGPSRVWTPRASFWWYVGDGVVVAVVVVVVDVGVVVLLWLLVWCVLLLCVVGVVAVAVTVVYTTCKFLVVRWCSCCWR
jgi:hypothetical protein